MKNVYVAVRCIYPEKEQVIGVYSNPSAAKSCVNDSFYPSDGRVLKVNLSKVQDTYIALSSYRDWENEVKDTYYLFRNNSSTIPEHWMSSVDIEIIKRDLLYSIRSPNDVFDLPEKSLMAIMGFMIDDECDDVIVIHERSPGTIAFLCMADHPRPLARGQGAPDRARLIKICHTFLSRYWQAKDGGEIFFDDAGKAVDDFWRHFVLGRSRPPEEWFSDWF